MRPSVDENGSDRGILGSVLDLIPLGIVIIDPDGAVFRSNRYAEELLDQNALAESDSSDIRLAVVSLGESEEPFEVDDNHTIPLGERIEAIRECISSSDDGRYKAVLIQDLRSELAAESVRNRWNLTTTEARVSCLLASGMNVETIAAELGVTTSTVRTHLKNIFAKTGARRQADLVRLLLHDLNSISSALGS